MGKKKGKSKGSKQGGLSETIKDTGTLTKLDSEIDVITAAISAANQTVFLKVCRLCESKDGPFLNIFDADKITAKKIDELMPFGVAENDDLPHKICFRCSAKVEELYEFIQKCIKTQHSLRKAMGKKEPLAIKPKTRVLWEEKLNKSNMSNDDICDALIKKAMEGIKDIPLSPLPPKQEKPTKEEKPAKEEKPPQEEKPTKDERSPREQKPSKEEKTPVIQKKDNKQAPASKKETKSIVQEEDSDRSEDTKETSDSDCKFVPTRASRSKNAVENLLDGLPDVRRKKLPNKQDEAKPTDTKSTENSTRVNKNKSINSLSFDYEDSDSYKKMELKPKVVEAPAIKTKPVEPPKPFNIMDHISMIKVNSVGVLFQCKLCNRNFLKKELVMSHGCAKNGGVPKVDFIKHIVPPAPPKASVVKYINTKIAEPIKPVEHKPEIINQEVEIKKTNLETKPKPKIGPASKVKRQDNHGSVIGMTVVPMEVNSPTPKPGNPIPAPSINNPVVAPSVQFPTLPSLNSRYKLVPGPNNTFQLVEETDPESEKKIEKPEEVVKETKGKKRKSDPPKATESKFRRQIDDNKGKQISPEVINLDEQPVKQTNSGGQPYPVGLFQTLPHHSGIFVPPVVTETPFTTPAMKKQSYTVVQTGNPSKLLISTKPQLPPEEPPKRKSKKSKPEVKQKPVDNKKPYNVTLEDATPAKDPGFFTFINVDPLLQPSYVLPTDNIIQESQISTSTPASKNIIDNKDSNKYSCNMCTETFTREKKLLTHIQSHYNKMDEEDEIRAGHSRKRGRKH